MTDARMAYVGISPCGCAQAATVDDAANAAQVRRDVARFLKWGHVERWSSARVRVAFCCASHRRGCPHPGGVPGAVEGGAVMTPDLRRYLTQPSPRRERGRVVEVPDHGLSPAERKRAELWKAVYALQTDYPELSDQQAKRLAGHWTMLRRWIRRDRHLPLDAAAALGTICLLLWIAGWGRG